MNKAWWAARGIARLVGVVLLSLLLAALGYVVILTVIMLFPPHATQ